MVSFWIPYFQYPSFPSTVGTSDRKRHPLICVTHRRLHFYFDPEKLLHPTLQTSHISPNLLAKYSSLTFPICFCILLGYVVLFWQNLASSKPMSAISLCMGCCQVVCLTERPWTRLGAWLCRLGVTINWRITSWGTKIVIHGKLYIAICSYKFSLGLEHRESDDNCPQAIVACSGSINCSIVTSGKLVLWRHFDSLSLETS